MNRPLNVYGEPSGHPADYPGVRTGHTVTEVEPDAPQYPDMAQPEPVRRPRYLVPPGLAAQAAKEAVEDVPEATVVDAIAADAKPKTEWPEGCPKMRPLFKLPFRQRGAAMKLFAALQKAQAAVPERKEGEPVTPEMMAATYDNLAAMDDFLVTCAVDEGAYRDWVLNGDGANEGVFVQFWNAFAERMQPGEASSSSS